MSSDDGVKLACRYLDLETPAARLSAPFWSSTGPRAFSYYLITLPSPLGLHVPTTLGTLPSGAIYYVCMSNHSVMIIYSGKVSIGI